MIPYEQRDTVQVLYATFSRQPYMPATSWTTTREFTLDPLYQQTVTQYAADPLFEKQQHEFVLDTSLVPPPGIEPGSSDFQSGA
jgi:hypothetical protein